MELEKRGVTNFILTTDTFLPLVQAQAKARKMDPHVIVVKHPIGGLNAEELAERIDTASNGLKAAIEL
ncbi:MAG: hypothetical protein HOK21_09675 [Rhodospirillaceae bacterium]|nr:hypothetical protein [Rhodospirillaceae bacterium]MBT4045944.1 hypothetical protein [Rhodospirillaceae bacterium]MBT4687675.1 hypothetical protein [Rhodospirillaceae bacterium]MBT5082901.1 hypothetical protein [Rhodospirillaceae bacterium]MBT5524345.1 hypothetical protein [Rhodospirillaceae bacterium]